MQAIAGKIIGASVYVRFSVKVFASLAGMRTVVVIDMTKSRVGIEVSYARACTIVQLVQSTSKMRTVLSKSCAFNIFINFQNLLDFSF